jgi:hypothetical protein
MHELTTILHELRQGVVRPTMKARRQLIQRPPTPPRRPRLTPPDPPKKTLSMGCRGVTPRLEIKTKETKKKLDALQKKADEFRKQLSLHSIDAHSEIN